MEWNQLCVLISSLYICTDIIAGSWIAVILAGIWLLTSIYCSVYN